MMRAKTIITVMVLLAVAMIAVPSADAARSLNFSKFRSKDKKDATGSRPRRSRGDWFQKDVRGKSEMPAPIAPEPEPEVNIESQIEMPAPIAPEPEPEVNIESQTEKQQDADADADSDADGEEKGSGSEVLSHSGGDKDKCWSPLWNRHVHHGQMGAEKCCWYGDWTHKSKCGGHDDDKDKDKCWSPLWNKHVHHGEMGAEKCCWYGDWTHKSKCDGHDDDKDKDKCWSPLWNKHVHHGQMGAKKCCWYGDWTHKSKCDGQ